MRKWAIIGATLLLVVLVSVFIPRRDSIEYHIRAYREADRRLTAKETVIDELKDVFRKIRSERIGRKGRLREEMRQHKQELIRLGYLDYRTFEATNSTAAELAAAIQKAMLQKARTTNSLGAATVPGAPTVYVISAKGMMPDWNEIGSELRAALIDADKVPTAENSVPELQTAHGN